MSDSTEREGPKPRLVGARRRETPTSDIEIPVNLERALLVAARDRRFRDELLADPLSAAASRQIAFSASERAMLGSMTREALSSMIARLEPSQQRNSSFAKVVAGAIAGTVILSSGCVYSTGIDPEYDAGGTEDADHDEDRDSDR